MVTRKAGNGHTIKAVILIALIGLMYYQTVIWLFIRWGRGSSYYSHGYLVAPIALFLAWRKRAEIRAALGEQRSRGARKQGSGGGEEQRSRGAGEQGSGGAGEQGSGGAGEQGSGGAGEQGSSGAGEQGSGGGEEQGVRGPSTNGGKPRLSTLGLIIMCCGLVIHVVSAFWRVHFTSGFSIIPVLIGLVLYIYGASVARHVLLPILFLAFMIPFPLVAVARISLNMKLFATNCVTHILQMLGVTVVQDGSRIHFAHDSILVGDVCSGLRSLIALLAFGVLFAHLTPTSRLKKTILLIASVPAALIANIVRILIMGLITNCWGVEYTQGVIHSATGMLIFIVAFILLFGLERILDRPRADVTAAET